MGSILYWQCSQLWSKTQKPRLAVVVVMVWYRMFISDPIVTSTRKTNRNILDFKYFFLPCHVPCFPCARYQRSGLSKIRANIFGTHNSFKYWHLTDYIPSGWCFSWRQTFNTETYPWSRLVKRSQGHISWIMCKNVHPHVASLASWIKMWFLLSPSLELLVCKNIISLHTNKYIDIPEYFVNSKNKLQCSTV